MGFAAASVVHWLYVVLTWLACYFLQMVAASPSVMAYQDQLCFVHHQLLSQGIAGRAWTLQLLCPGPYA